VSAPPVRGLWYWLFALGLLRLLGNVSSVASHVQGLSALITLATRWLQAFAA
jgi:hypothetical protein